MGVDDVHILCSARHAQCQDEVEKRGAGVGVGGGDGESERVQLPLLDGEGHRLAVDESTLVDDGLSGGEWKEGSAGGDEEDEQEREGSAVRVLSWRRGDRGR